MSEKLRVGQEQPSIKEFTSFDEISADPKAKGLRPWHKYAGGQPDEIIIVAGVKYRKESVADIYLSRTGESKPMTESQFFSHSFEQADGSWSCGPGWDSHVKYLMEGWWKQNIKPSDLSDLPLYNLVPIDEK